MENAVEALKLAFAVILLTLALSLSISYFSKARETSELVLATSDKQRYYDYDDNQYTIPEDTSGNRIVGYETIIPTLYKYDKERYKVTFKKGKYDATTGELTDVQPLEIYESKSTRANWSESYTNDFDGRTTSTGSYNEMSICSFDIVEEAQRNEPWVGNSKQIKLHLDAIFSGGEYQLPQYPLNSGHTLSYGGNPLTERDEKFVEQIGEITTTSSDDESEESTIKGNKTTTKRIITYIRIN